MLKFTTWIAIVTLLSGLLCAGSSIAGKQSYRIGYIEAGEYWTYSETYNAIKTVLSKQDAGGSVTYPKELHVSPGWDHKAELESGAKRLMGRKDVDLIISAGTAATAAILAHNNGKTPVLAIAVADAVKSKFVASQEDSGTDNFTVRIVPGRYKRMFQIFHQVVGFKKLGLIYPDNENGRKYANVEDAHEVARELGFDIIAYEKIGDAESTTDCDAGIAYLIGQGVDAFFIPALNCFDWKLSDVAMLLGKLTRAQIATFSREGTRTVKAGALMGFSTYDFAERGEFFGERVLTILNGTLPRTLTMVDKATPKISLNLKVAADIGFDPSVDILAASDEIFQEITLPEDRLKRNEIPDKNPAGRRNDTDRYPDHEFCFKSGIIRKGLCQIQCCDLRTGLQRFEAKN